MGWKDHEPAAGGTGDGSRSWRQPTTGRPAPDPRHVSAVTKARGKQFLASSLAVASAVIFIFLISLIFKGCSNTAVFVVTRDDYEANTVGAIPLNWMGESDAKSLQALNSPGRFHKFTVTAASSAKDFRTLLPRDDKEKNKTCVIYLSAHAILETFLDDDTKNSLKVSETDVVLLAKDDDFNPKTDRLRLSALWGALKKLPPEQKKLLLLDLGRLQGRWRLGVFDNFVIEGIAEAVQREKIPNLFVITACSSGESSWVGPHLGESGQSVFAHFVSRGLSGEADGTGGKRDGSITVRELFQFVHTRVNDWVKNNRDPSGQHPQMFSFDADIEKTLQAKEDKTFSIRAINTRKSDESKSSTKSHAISTDTIAPLQEQFAGLWKRRQTLEQPIRSANVIYHFDPVGFRALTHRLMRAEEFVIHQDTTHATAELEKAEALCRKLEDHARQGRFAAAEFPASEKFLRRLSDRYGLGSTPESVDSAPQPSANSSPDELPDEHLALVLSRAHKQHGMPAAMKEDSEPAQRCRDALLKVRQLAERVAFGHHTVLPWLRRELPAADQLRREAEDRFFVVEVSDALRQPMKLDKGALRPGDSADKASEILALAEMATLRFNELEKRAQALEQAQFVLNRACATLPEWLAFVSDRSTTKELRNARLDIMNQYHAPLRKKQEPTADLLAGVWLTSKDNRPNTMDQLDKEILSVALEAIELRRRLPTQFGDVPQDLDKNLAPFTLKLTALLDRVQQQLNQEAGDLLNTSQPQPIHWRLMRDLLRCPSLEPKTRQELFDKLIQLRFKDGAAPRDELEPSPSNDHQTAVWQMLCGIHALSLVPDPTGKASDKLWDEWHSVSVEDSRIRPERLIQFSRKLRDHWIRHSEEVITQCGSWERSRNLARNCLEQKDLSARILFGSDAINLQEQPTRNYERFLIAELLLDTSERYLDDFWKDWYSATAQSCFTASERLSGKLLEQDDVRQRVDKLFKSRGSSELRLKAEPVVFGTQKSAPGSVSVNHMAGLPRGLATSWLAYNDGGPPPSLADICWPHSIGLSVTDTATTQATSRFSIVLPNDPTPQKIGGCQPSLIVPKVFFRDHTWSNQVFSAFNPCKPAGTLIRHLAAPSSGAIQVTGEDRKSIVFVLDASRSMLREGNELNEDRWKPAKDILLDVLKSMLAANPAGGVDRKIELIVFGQMNPQNPNDKNYIHSEVSMTQLTNAVVNRIGKVLDGITPTGDTPLMTAIIRACRSLEAANESGIIIAITDGVPSEGILDKGVQNPFSKYKEVQKKLHTEIQALVDRNNAVDRELELQIVGIGFLDVLPPNPADAVKGQFDAQKLLEELRPVHRAVNGIQGLEELLKVLTKPRDYYLVEDRFSRNDQAASLNLKRATPNRAVTNLPSGNYRLAFGSHDRLKDGHRVTIHGGELLDYELLPNRDLRHIHSQLLTESVAFQPATQKSGYRFGFIQSFKANNDRAEFVVGIQDLASGANRQMAYTQRPERLVIEIQPKKQPLKSLQPITYRIEPGKSDPTWTVQLDGWQSTDNDAEIKAYANWERVPEDQLLALSPDAKWPSTMSLPISKTVAAKFQVEVETPANDRVDLDDSVEVRLRLSDAANAALFASDWRHLAYLHVQLRLDGQPLTHLDETAEVIASENEIRWKFSNLPKENFSAKQLKIAVTSWYTFKLHALATESPLLIKAE